MKKEPVIVGTILAITLIASVALFVAAFTGCSSGPTDTQCTNAKKVVAAYEASLLIRTPSEDETKIAMAAKAILILYCGDQGSVEPVIAQNATKDVIATVRQPLRVTTGSGLSKKIYYRHVPFSMLVIPHKLSDATTVFIGPMYRLANSESLYLPDINWLHGSTKEPVMTEVK